MEDDLKELWFLIKVIILMVLVAFLLSSCKTVKYVEKEVPVEKVRTEYKTNIRIDSIYIKDSTNTYSRGDTVFKDNIKLIYKDRSRTDTIHKTDSIDKPVYIRTTEVKEVNKLTKMQKFLGWSGGISWLLFILFLTRKIKHKIKI